MSATKNLKPRSRVEVKVNFLQNQILHDIAWYDVVLEFFSSFTSVTTPSPVPLPSCFHPISMTLLERSTGPTPEHPSNTTKVSQVSNATGTPLDSILFHHSETWSHRPPCQAPGLGSFIANVIVPQVDVRNCLVDFQCFGKGLWTKTMSNHVKLQTWELAMGFTGVCCNAHPTIVVAGYLRRKPCRFLDATSGAVFLSASGLKTSESNINYRMFYAGRTWEVPAVKAICWRLKAPHRTYVRYIVDTCSY